jgi:uncharacterized membrane protein YoaK (UPF0700 family)
LSERRDGKPEVDPRTVRALLTLTFTAGMIDAVAFLGLEQVFAANMTGNLIVLGLAIAGAPALSIGGPAAALAAFLIGAAASGRFDRRSESRHRRLLRMVRIEALAVALAVLVAIGFESGDEVRRFVIIVLLASAMGARNETVRRINVPELRTTVQTLAIAGIAAHEAEGRVREWGDRLRVLGILAMLSGAVVSALLVLNADLAWALLAVAAAEAIALLLLTRDATGRAGTLGP